MDKKYLQHKNKRESKLEITQQEYNEKHNIIAKKLESFGLDSITARSFLESVMQDSILQHFTIQELNLLINKRYFFLLHEIFYICTQNFLCFSIIDSKISAFYTKKLYFSFIQNNEKNKNILKYFNGFHLVLDSSDKDKLITLIYKLKPWRKGPFFLHFDENFSIKNLVSKNPKNKYLLEKNLSQFSINQHDAIYHDITQKIQDLCQIPNTESNHHTSYFFIDSEWKSNKKMQLILYELEKLYDNLSDKEVLDVGCNNGYYMFDLAMRVKHITGIDPIPIFFLQFYYIYKLSALHNVSFRLLGIKDLHQIPKKFDIILCLGVLYHYQEPLEMLKVLRKSLKKDGILLLETLIIQTQDSISLCPYPTYAKMSNVFFIFSPKALQNIALHAGFHSCELLSFSYTSNDEQRTTEFIQSQSLGDFLSKEKTIEGYPPACRGIFLLR